MVNDSLIDIAKQVKCTDPLRAGLLAMCWESGSCQIHIKIARDIDGPEPGRTLISHGCSGFLFWIPAISGLFNDIKQWLDEQHSPFEAF